MPFEQRITLRQVVPNPLFEEWLTEWLAYAERKNSKRKHALAKALCSLRKYPLVMHNGKDCSILDGFGQTICRMLDKQLKVYRQNSANATTDDAGNIQLLSEAETEKSFQEVVVKVQAKLERKKQLKRKMKIQQDTNSDELSSKVLKDTENPMLDIFAKYKDRDDLANDDNNEVVEVADCKDNGMSLVVPADSYDIVLLVDTQETAGKSKRSLDTTIKELERNQVQFEVRRLSVGDFLWICRSRSNPNSEYVLPYIVERKRMDDLANSIKDGRFHEQKFRLCHSGIANVIYMIESRGNNQHVGMPLQNLLQAATNTQVQNGFVVKFTNSHVGSMRYLVVLTELLEEIYQNKPLVVCKSTKLADDGTNDNVPVLVFKQFSVSTTKMQNFPVRDLFVRQLLQLKTLTLEKALSIVQHYPTPSRLLRAYTQCSTQKEAEMLLANITFGPTKKTIGSVISQCMYHFYHAQQTS